MKGSSAMQAFDALPIRMKKAVDILHGLFRGRNDAYGLQIAEKKFARKEELTKDVWARHVMGECLIGVYPIWNSGIESVLQWFSFDIDFENQPEKAIENAKKISEAGTKLGIPIHFELSKSKGIHAHIFLASSIPSWQGRSLGKLILTVAELKEFQLKNGHGTEEIRIFPKQDSTSGMDYGSFMFLPWCGRYTREGRTLFLDQTSWVPYLDQVEEMASPEKLTLDSVSSLIKAHDLKPANVSTISPSTTKTKKTTTVDPAATGRASPGGIDAITDKEFDVLCTRLRTLRKARKDPPGVIYQEWLGALTHLVPFANGRELAHRLSALDAKRYDTKATDLKFDECIKIYSRPDRAGKPSTAQLIIESIRGGGRSDITPISHIYGVWKGVFVRRNWSCSNGNWTENEPNVLANFSARVDAEEFQSDGVSVNRLFVSSGYLDNGERLQPCEVRACDFQEHKIWMHKAWGVKPYITIGQNHSAMVKECLALTAREAPQIDTYSHLGWTKVKDRYVFLTATGSVGSKDDQEIALSTAKENMRVPKGLNNFSIPDDVTDEQAKEAFSLLEQAADIASKQITIPIISAMFLAPLASFLPIDFVLYLYGITGSRKSSLVAAFLNLYGSKWHKDSLPTNFRSTWNAVETIAFSAKDCPVVVDNYIPEEGKKAQSMLQHLIQSVGDHAGRARLSADSTLMEARAIRSFVIVTGEDRPHRASSMARCYPIQFARETVNNTRLAALQAAGTDGRLVPAMSHYLHWLQGKLAEPDFIEQILSTHRQIARDLQATIHDDFVHGRSVEQEAWIRIGLELAKAAHPAGGWSTNAFHVETHEALTKTREDMQIVSRESSLAHRFLSTVFTLFGNQARITSPTGMFPYRDAEMLGWQLQPGADVYSPREQKSIQIGFLEAINNGSELILDADLAYGLVKTTCLRQGEPLVESFQAVSGSLASYKLLLHQPENKYFSHYIIGERRLKSWRFDYGAVLEFIGIDPMRSRTL